MEIFRIAPFSTTKSLVGLNEHCARAKPGEYIQIMDWDAMVLDRRAYNVMEKAIFNYPHCDIFGALLNRCNLDWQQLGDPENFGMLYHFKKAENYAQVYGSGLCSEPVPFVAGAFMLFKQEYWAANPFPEKIVGENGKTFDKVFCQNAAEIRVILGAYIFHRHRALYEDKGMGHLLP